MQDTGFGLWVSNARKDRKDHVDAEEYNWWFHVGFLFGVAGYRLRVI
jgi:hypothetical protein